MLQAPAPSEELTTGNTRPEEFSSPRGESESGFRRDLSILREHQKSSRGAPLYSLYINRPLGRVFAALANTLGMNPNQVSILSALFSLTGIVGIATLEPSPTASVLIAVALVLGYAIDSADGQLARLQFGGSVAGEWLDHSLDAFKIAAFHASLIVSILQFQQAHTLQAVLLVAAFEVVAVTGFFTYLLTELLRRSQGEQTRATLSPTGWKRVATLPTDWGVLCLWTACRFSPAVFFGGYAVMFAVSAAYLAATSLVRFREFSALDQLRRASS
ncbi:MAG TPA: CDP-alcohol phosphatidyltransferase [Acidimicrobiaceae bacterium]|jgi:CDP-diacylglycerol--serine O-phosphatidyltransferase|nr:CDP-alcohol phosphatidyltransferase [Acidimicrobiaceae bacterium]